MLYNVEFSPPAERDLLGIYTYISDTLKDPGAAFRLYQTLKAEISSLSYMPERYAVLGLSPYKEQGIRKMLVENYIVFYRVDRDIETVIIVRIVYNRREWRDILDL